MIGQYKCPSYADDDGVVQGCECGKCDMSKQSELDEIIGTHMDSGEIFPRMSKKEAKQAILDWHNKQTLELLDRLQQRTVRGDIILGESAYIAITRAIEAERNKLKEQTNE